MSTLAAALFYFITSNSSYSVMNDEKRQIKARETWVKTFEELGSVSKAARKCGIPRSTLYRWIKRPKMEGKDSLKGHSKRPRKLAKQKLNDTLEQLIQSLRLTYNFGPQRIQTHLLRVHHVDLSSATIWRVLKKHHIPAIKKYRKHQDYTRYNRPVPGDRVQLDVTKVGSGDPAMK